MSRKNQLIDLPHEDDSARRPFKIPGLQNKGVVHLNSLAEIPCLTDEAAAYPAISPVWIHHGKFLITIKIVS